MPGPGDRDRRRKGRVGGRRRPVALAAILAVLGAGAAAGPAAVSGQEEAPPDEPAAERLLGAVRSSEISLGVLLQFAADFQDQRTAAGRNGFGVANARVNLGGDLDGGVGYFVQTNFGSLLDLRLSWTADPALTVDGGLYKTPFSAEFLTPAGAIDFVSRARVVNALRPGRQAGVQLRGRVAGGRLEYRVGAFNGSASPTGNDDDHFAFGGRLALESPLGGDPGGRVTVGVNGFTSDDPARFLGTTPDRITVTGIERLLGVDVRVTRGPWSAGGEWIVSNPDDDDPDGARPRGWQATVGRAVGEDGELLVRWDAFRPEVEGVPDSDLLILGYNHRHTSLARLQANVEVPTREGVEPRLRLVAQVGF